VTIPSHGGILSHGLHYCWYRRYLNNLSGMLGELVYGPFYVAGGPLEILGVDFR